jgi:hypothetical protein
VTPADLLARATELRHLADALETEARQQATITAQPSPALDLGSLRAEFGFSRESLASAARDGLSVHRGPRGRLLAFRSDVESWIRSRAWAPSTRRLSETEPEDESLARAERELLAADGCGTRRGQPKKASKSALQETPPCLRVVTDQESSTYEGRV